MLRPVKAIHVHTIIDEKYEMNLIDLKVSDFYYQFYILCKKMRKRLNDGLWPIKRLCTL